MLCCLDRMARGAETEENWLHLESRGECALTSTNWVDKAAVCADKARSRRCAVSRFDAGGNPFAYARGAGQASLHTNSPVSRPGPAVVGCRHICQCICDPPSSSHLPPVL